MTTLATDIAVKIHAKSVGRDQPVIASDIIYQGAAVGKAAAGTMRPLVAGDPFMGFAAAQADNSLGAASAINVKLITKGVARLPVSGASLDDKGKPVYASDDATFTLTASTNSYIGRVKDYPASGYLDVEFDADKAEFGHIAELTTGSGGTADGVAEAVTIGAALTGASGGTANGALETHTVMTDLTNPVGTANGAMETVGATNGGDVSAAIMNNFRELTTKLTEQIAINLIISNNVAELTAARVADAATLLSLKNNVTELETVVNGLLRMVKGQ